jgi:hypothetical protein
MIFMRMICVVWISGGILFNTNQYHYGFKGSAVVVTDRIHFQTNALIPFYVI